MWQSVVFGRWGDGRATVRQAVHDGDTVKVEADGNLGVRFLWESVEHSDEFSADLM